MERTLRLPDSRIVKDEQEIDKLLKERKSLLEHKKTIPPSKVLENFDLTHATLSKRERVLVGEIEANYGREEPFKNPLFEIPDIKVDLTPEAVNLPRRVICFELSDGEQTLTVETLYDETSGEYWENYGDESKLEEIVTNNLLAVLGKKGWQCDWTGAWSVVR